MVYLCATCLTLLIGNEKRRLALNAKVVIPNYVQGGKKYYTNT